MAIVNRDVDQSQQKVDYSYCFNPAASGLTNLVTGVSLVAVGPIPYPYTLDSVRFAALGVSGAPVVRVLITRFVGGATTLVAGNTMALQNFGTSGVIGNSLGFVVGNTLLAGQAGDYLGLDVFGANTAVQTLLVDYVVKKTQDVLQWNGI